MKHIGNLFEILILTGALIASFALMAPVHASGQINMLTHSGWIDSIGYYHVSGEVQNTGDAAVDFVRVTATFYDSSNTVVAVDSTYTALSVVLPGRKSPFEVLLIDSVQALKVNHYGLGITFSNSGPIPMGLEILSNSSYVDGIGYMHVAGEIKNIETGTATFVKIIGTFYDSNGHVIATDFTYSDPYNIGAGQTAPFQLLLTYEDRVTLTASYSLTAESNQYALVPEFARLVVLPLFIITVLFAVTVSKRKRRF